MTDPRLERMFRELEASFEGAEAFAEELAAADLSDALTQDADVYTRIRTWRGAMIADDGGAWITEVGEDYAGCGEPLDRLVPLSSAVIVRSQGIDGVQPRKVSRRLCLALRLWSRQGSRVTVDLGTSSVTGRLEASARDHLVIVDASRRVLIPLPMVRSVKLSHED